MNLRKITAAVAIAGAAVFGIAACSNSEKDSTTTGTTPSVVTDTNTSETSATAAASELSSADAQTILRTALDSKTSSDDLEKVVDTTNPATKKALQAFTKVASMAGYTPDVFTVKSVKANGADKATATVAVASPHAPEPVDMPLVYVKTADGKWKLSADAVTQLASMGSSHGH